MFRGAFAYLYAGNFAARSGAAEPDSASEPAGRGVLAGAPRGPPKRTLLASVFAQAQKVLDPPYRTVRAGLAFVVRAGKSAIGRA